MELKFNSKLVNLVANNIAYFASLTSLLDENFDHVYQNPLTSS